MARVSHKDTKPEMRVRRLVHGMGYRYRLHGADLPGRPDLVFRGRRKVIFVHGCFWHRHPGCKLARIPKSRTGFWTEKLEANRARDLRNEDELRATGWSVEIVWECELRDLDSVQGRLKRFLEEEI